MRICRSDCLVLAHVVMEFGDEVLHHNRSFELESQTSFEASKSVVQHCVSSKLLPFVTTIETKMSELFGKPFWLEEASREMRSRGLGDEESAPGGVAEQEAEPSSFQDFITVEEIMNSSYEPTMDTNTSSEPTRKSDMEIQEYLDTEINKMRNVSVENHTKMPKTPCAPSQEKKTKENLDTNRSDGASTRKQVIKQTAETENNKRVSERKVSKKKQRRNRCKKLVKRSKRKISPEVGVPLKDLLPKVVPLCYRVSKDVPGVAESRTITDPRYFNLKDLIHMNTFSYNLIYAEIQARLKGILNPVRITELTGKATHPIFVNQAKSSVVSTLVKQSKPSPATTLGAKQEEKDIPEPLQPSSIEANDGSAESCEKENEDASPVTKELQHSVSIESMPSVEEPSLEEIALEDVKASSIKYRVNRHVDSETTETTLKGRGDARQKSWTRRKLESLTSCFRRKHGNQTASPFNDSTDATVADPNVATSPGTVTGPAPQEITPSNTAQTSNNKATESHSAEKDTLVKASAVQNRWLQLLTKKEKRKYAPATLPDVEIEMLPEPQEPVIRPAPFQPGRRHRRFNFWCFQCFYTPAHD